MNGLEFIKLKQQSWARRKGLTLTGGTIPDRGEKNYLSNLSDNLFENLTEASIKCYHSGDGKETKDSKTRLAKMKALHSSSAIVVNLFQYWQGKDVCPILNACKLSSRTNKTGYMMKNIGSASPTATPITPHPLNYEIKFEGQFEISKNKSLFPRTPNIDVVISTPISDIAIESKFTEPYGSNKHKGLKQKYVDKISFWDGLPNLYELAKEISPDNTKFRYLDAAQLIKHILGLKNNGDKYNSQIKPTRNGRRLFTRSFHLLYLWYDVTGKEGVEHRKEIEQFAEIARKDHIKFSHITYQEVILKLAKEFYEGNEKYLAYMTERYL